MENKTYLESIVAKVKTVGGIETSHNTIVSTGGGGKTNLGKIK